MKRSFLLAVAIATASHAAFAQVTNNVGSLWRGPVTVVARATDSAATKRTSDSLNAARRLQQSQAAKRIQDSIAKRAQDSSVARHTRDSVLAKHVRDSVVAKQTEDSLSAARASQLDQIARSLQEFVAQLRGQTSAHRDSVAPTLAPIVPAVVTTPAPVVPAVSAVMLVAKIDSLQAAQKEAAKKAAETEKVLTQKVAGLGNFRFSGDVRVRYEGQMQAGGFVTRHRERSRARLGVTGNVTDDLSGGIGFATGALDDVQSANQTQTGFFSRKSIGFDRFYLSWKPKAAHGVSVAAGKFAYPWERTSLTFGNDINPEGVSAAWALAHKGVFQGATVVGFALPFLEIAGENDSYAAGAQLQSRWKPGARTNIRASFASIAFHGVDAIAQAVVAGTIKPASGNTNRVRTDSAGKIIGYTSSFTYQDLLVALDYTPSPRTPIALQFNVVRNPNAQDGEGMGMFADLRFGRLSQPRDVQAAWSVYRVERDAVLGVFNEQDLRAATNVVSHKVTFAFQWRSNATVNAGLWLGRFIDPPATGKLAAPDFKSACTTAPFAGCRDPWLKRLQLDLSYKF